MKNILTIFALLAVTITFAKDTIAPAPHYDSKENQIDVCCQLIPLPDVLKKENLAIIDVIKAKKIDEALIRIDKQIIKIEALLAKNKGQAIASHPADSMILLNLLNAANNDKQSTYLVSPDWLIPYYLRAYIYIEKKANKQAMQALDKALSFSPFDPQTLSERGHLYNALKNWNEAEKDFSKAREMSQIIGDKFLQGRALRGLGYVAIEKKQWDKAIDFYQKALKLNPKDAKAIHELKYIEQQRNKK